MAALPPVPTGLLAGRRGVVLGVSSANSIGFHTAHTLRALGAEVAITCRPARLDRVTPLARELGAEVYPLDARDDASFLSTFAALGAGGRALDFLVHGLMDIPEGVLARPMLELSRGELAQVMEVAAWSLIAACRHARPLLANSDAPRVVALTSACSHRMTPNYHVAGMAKAALESAVVYLAMQLGRDGILVNAVGTSFLATDGALRAVGAANAAGTRAVQAKRSATGRAIEPAEVARCISFLCSPLAQSVTGEVLTVDGGFARAYL